MSPPRTKCESKNDLAILKFFMILGNITGLVSLKSKNKNCLFNIFILLLHIMALSCYYTVIRDNQKILPGKSIHVILTMAIFFSYLSLFTISSWKALCTRTIYAKILKNFRTFDEIMQKHGRMYSVYCLEVVLYHLIRILIEIIQNRNYIFTYFNKSTFILHLYSILMGYLKFAMTLIVLFILRVTMSRYENLRLYLKRFLRNPKHLSLFLKEIQKMKKACVLLRKNMNHIQVLFQFQYLCLLIQSFMYILICFNSILSSYLGQVSGKYKTESHTKEFHVIETSVCLVSAEFLFRTLLY